jgi:6-phospho-beta-glucosidase
MKLTVVGGGSTYTPELADGIARLALPVTELVLVDPDTHRLGLVGGVSSRIVAAYGHRAKVRGTAGLDDGLDGADVVIVQLRVGGQAARQRDETWPLEYGCAGQETTGPGGLAKALRTVPVVLEIAERARHRAPSAWIIDFTNPVGIVTRALLDAGHRAVGLCNVAIGFQRRFAALLGVAPDRVTLDHVGLNHLTWERAVIVDATAGTAGAPGTGGAARPAGADRLPWLLDRHAEEIAAEIGLPAGLVRGLGAVPSSYLRYYYAHDLVVAEQRGAVTRAEQVAGRERELLAMYADPSLDHKPALLGPRGGAYYSEAAVALIASLAAGAGDVQVVNVRNGGTLPFLPDDAVIEAPARICGRGPVPLPAAPVDPLFAGLIAHVSAYEELALAAAIHGGRDRAFAALLAHPLVGQAGTAARLADRLIAENRGQLAWARQASAGGPARGRGSPPEGTVPPGLAQAGAG